MISSGDLKWFLGRCGNMQGKLVEEVMFRDVYGVLGYGEDAFDYVIDLGACKGDFALLCRLLFPRAKIFAFEANVRNFVALQENLSGFGDVFLFNLAFSHLRDFRLFDHPRSEESNYSPDGSLVVPSISLDRIVGENGIDLGRSILFKSDIEGCEVSFMGRVPTAILKCVRHLAFEAHFRASTPRRRYQFYKDGCNEWRKIDRWVRRHFGVGWDVFYRGCGREGYGVYVIRRK